MAPDFCAPNSDKRRNKNHQTLHPPATFSGSKDFLRVGAPAACRSSCVKATVSDSQGPPAVRLCCFYTQLRTPNMPLEWCRSNPRQLLIRNDRNETLGNTDPKPNEFHYKICIRFRGHGSRWIIVDQHSIGTELTMWRLYDSDVVSRLRLKNNVHVQKLSAVFSRF